MSIAETREREKQAPCREPDAGLDPATPGLHPETKIDAQPLRHPGIPTDNFLMFNWTFLFNQTALYLTLTFKNKEISNIQFAAPHSSPLYPCLNSHQFHESNLLYPTDCPSLDRIFHNNQRILCLQSKPLLIHSLHCLLNYLLKRQTWSLHSPA